MYPPKPVDDIDRSDSRRVNPCKLVLKKTRLQQCKRRQDIFKSKETHENGIRIVHLILVDTGNDPSQNARTGQNFMALLAEANKQ